LHGTRFLFLMEFTPNTETRDEYKTGQRLAILGMVVSGALAFAKISGGLFSGSTALTADGLESASDVLMSGIVFGGMAIARRPPDERFPYGYGRAESLAGKTVATILLMSAVLLATHSLHKFSKEPNYLPAWTLWPLAASFVAKCVLSSVKYRAGKRLRSSSLMADALNDSVDIVSATVAAAAIALTLYDPKRFAYADPAGGLGVAIIIFLMGIQLFRRTSSELMDVMPDEDLVQAVRAAAEGVPGVRRIEKCFGRKSGVHFFFDVHVEVDGDMKVVAAHELGHAVKSTIRRQCTFVKDVLVHIEPHED